MVAAEGNVPPPYGTIVSVSPMNVSTGIGRDGTQLVVGLTEIGNAIGAAAANRSAASHASRWVIAPPFERPVAYTRRASIAASVSILATSARVKATSSAAFEQQIPPFHAFETPCGCTTMKPAESESVLNPEIAACTAAVEESPW